MTKPNVPRCTEEVWRASGNWGDSAPCRFRARFDPDDAGTPTRCKIHSAAAIAERRQKSNEKYRADLERRLAPQKKIEQLEKLLCEARDALIDELQAAGDDDHPELVSHAQIVDRIDAALKKK